MAQLVPGVFYGWKTRPGLFGIYDRWYESHECFLPETSTASTWYNKHGEHLGGGILSREDLRNAALGLESGELLIVKDHGHTPPKSQVPDPVDWLSKCVRRVVTTRRVYTVCREEADLVKYPGNEVNGVFWGWVKKGDGVRAMIRMALQGA